MPDVSLRTIEIEVVEKKTESEIKYQANLVLIITNLKSRAIKHESSRYKNS